MTGKDSAGSARTVARALLTACPCVAASIVSWNKRPTLKRFATIRPMINRIAGPIEAAKQAATDCRVTTANRIMVIEGGIRMPSSDEMPSSAEE